MDVDEGDTFFFDHPLDHVPGMLLFDRLLLAAEQVAGRVAEPARPGQGHRLRAAAADVRFVAYCEKDEPALIRIGPIGPTGAIRPVGATGAEDVPPRLRVGVFQQDEPICTGEISLVPTAERAEFVSTNERRKVVSTAERQDVVATAERPESEVCGAPLSPGTWQPPASRALVHKQHGANVLVGPLEQAGGGGFEAAMARPPQHRIRDLHPFSLLVEAARQFTLMVMHRVEDIPLGWQFILGSVEVWVPGPVDWSPRMRLRCHPKGEGRRARQLDTEILVGARTLGWVSFGGRTVPAAVYQRLRSAGRGGAEASTPPVPPGQVMPARTQGS